LFDARSTVQGSVQTFGALVGLSAKQVRILTLTMQGLERKEVARELGCSVKTVETHWKRILGKTRCTSERRVISHMLHWIVRTLTGERPP
jgi:DNA-binding CsgD family transcriptional regulator